MERFDFNKLLIGDSKHPDHNLVHDMVVRYNEQPESDRSGMIPEALEKKRKKKNLLTLQGFGKEPTHPAAIDDLVEFLHYYHYSVPRDIKYLLSSEKQMFQCGKVKELLETKEVISIILRTGTTADIEIPQMLLGDILTFIKENSLLTGFAHPKSIRKGTKSLKNTALHTHYGSRLLTYLWLQGYSKEFVSYTINKDVNAFNKALQRGKGNQKHPIDPDAWPTTDPTYAIAKRGLTWGRTSG